MGVAEEATTAACRMSDVVDMMTATAAPAELRERRDRDAAGPIRSTGVLRASRKEKTIND